MVTHRHESVDNFSTARQVDATSTLIVVPAAGLDAVRKAPGILLYGITGSGMSIATGRIANRLRLCLPCHLVDERTWEPGWTPVDPDEQRNRLSEIDAQDSWV